MELTLARLAIPLTAFTTIAGRDQASRRQEISAFFVKAGLSEECSCEGRMLTESITYAAVMPNGDTLARMDAATSDLERKCRQR